MFKELPLSTLPDISKWNTINVTDMRYMFEGCSSLISLPDISKLITNKVIYMSYMFNGCSSLLSLPDILKWITNNAQDMNSMLNGCSKLLSLPNGILIMLKIFILYLEDAHHYYLYLIFQNGILVML